MQKENWRKRWLSSINELTSIELQRKSWLDKENTNPHWSFVEFMCSYFDDLVIDDNYKYQIEKNWISKDEHLIISDWHSKLDKYEAPNKDDYNIVGILEDDNWLNIVEIGRAAKEKLVNQLTKDEKEILIETIDYTRYKTIKKKTRANNV
jgi:hypothetical protein